MRLCGRGREHHRDRAEDWKDARCHDRGEGLVLEVCQNENFACECISCAYTCFHVAADDRCIND